MHDQGGQAGPGERGHVGPESVTVALTDEGRDMRERTRHIPDVIGAAMGIDGPTVLRLREILRTITASATAHAAKT